LGFYERSFVTYYKQTIIQKRIKGCFCLWLTPELKATMNTQDKLLHKGRKSNSATDWNSYKLTKIHCNNAVTQAKSGKMNLTKTKKIFREQ